MRTSNRGKRFFHLTPVSELLLLFIILLLTACSANLPPEKPMIFSRRDSAAVGDTILIGIYCVDPEDQLVTYYIEWGDTSKPAWSYFFPSGETINRTHIYTEPGSYGIRVKAKDIDRAESEWSEPFNMRILPRSQ